MVQFNEKIPIKSKREHLIEMVKKFSINDVVGDIESENYDLAIGTTNILIHMIQQIRDLKKPETLAKKD